MNKNESHETSDGAVDHLYGLQEMSIGGVAFRVFRNGPQTMAELYQAAVQHSDNEFLIGLDWSMTYREVFGRAEALSRDLAARGVKKGDRVAIAMHNSAEWIIAFIGITACGATATLINYRASGDELARMVSDTGCAVLVGENDLIARLPQDARDGCDMIDEQCLQAITGDWAGLEIAPVPMEPEDEAVVIFTSGTTGGPKGALHTQRSLATSAVSIDYALRSSAENQALSATTEQVQPQKMPASLLVFPLFHSSGMMGTVLPAMRHGRRLATVRKWNVEEVGTLIDREAVMGMSGSPTMFWDLAEAKRAGRFSLASLKHCGVAGQALTSSLLHDLCEAFPGVAFGTGYGLTEGGAAVSAILGDDLIQRPGAVGKVTPFFDIRILGDDGEDAATGVSGEILLRSATVMREYCGHPAATAGALRDGWLHTGDVGYLDGEQYLHLTGRKKDVVISGGENITCTEVENAALVGGLVKEAVAFGVPDGRLGERLVLAVLPTENSHPTAQAIVDDIKTRIAIYKVPREIVFVSAFPRNAMGKVVRPALRDAYLSETGLA